MISAQTRELGASVPLTHRAYTGHFVTRALESGKTPVVHVQVRKKGETLCGIVLAIPDYSDNGEFFQVQTQLGVIWVESRNVRLCSGDGRCSCEVSA